MLRRPVQYRSVAPISFWRVNALAITLAEEAGYMNIQYIGRTRGRPVYPSSEMRTIYNAAVLLPRYDYSSSSHILEMPNATQAQPVHASLRLTDGNEVVRRPTPTPPANLRPIWRSEWKVGRWAFAYPQRRLSSFH